jgi:beta-lactamase class A
MTPLRRREFLGFVGATLAAGGRRPLMDEWQQIASATDGVVGATAMHLKSGQHAALNGQDSFPLASVCKMPIAMRLLALVDEGKRSLDEHIEVLPRDVWQSWDGDIGSRWPKQRQFRLDELIRLMVAHSDNTAVQTLFRVGGEGPGMTASLRNWHAHGIRVDRFEGQCSLDAHGVINPPPVEQWTPGLIKQLIARIRQDAQYAGMKKFLADPRDTATPDGTVDLLIRASRGDLLSPPSTNYLFEVMEATSTGKGRLKGAFPANTPVAHKTGTTDTIKGLNGATNDVGIILPRTVDQIAIAVYIKGSTRDAATRDSVIAQISKAAYDRWAA